MQGADHTVKGMESPAREEVGKESPGGASQSGQCGMGHIERDWVKGSAGAEERHTVKRLQCWGEGTPHCDSAGAKERHTVKAST